MQETSFILSLINIALDAGKILVDVKKQGYEIDSKSDDSPVTLADRKADEYITSHLVKLSNLPIISEEGKNILQDADDYWLIDPLDGTKSFIKNGKNYTVNIGLIKANYPMLGVIYAPERNELYFAYNNKSYFFEVDKLGYKFTEDDLKSSKILKVLGDPKDEPLKIVASKSHLSQETKDFVAKIDKEVEFVSSSSSIKFCFIANAEAHIYPRFSPTMQWDTAAGQAIAECAGATVINPKTKQRFSYKLNQDPENLLNGDFLVMANLSLKNINFADFV